MYLPTKFPGQYDQVTQVAGPPEDDSIVLGVSLGGNASGSATTRSNCFELTVTIDGSERVLRRSQVPCPLPPVEAYPITYGLESEGVIQERHETLSDLPDDGSRS